MNARKHTSHVLLIHSVPSGLRLDQLMSLANCSVSDTRRVKIPLRPIAIRRYACCNTTRDGALWVGDRTSELRIKKHSHLS